MHLSPSEAALQYSSMDNGRYHSDMHSDTEHRRYEQDMSVHDVDRHLPRPPHMPSSEVKKPNESRPSRSSRQRAAIACMYCRRRKVRSLPVQASVHDVLTARRFDAQASMNRRAVVVPIVNVSFRLACSHQSRPIAKLAHHCMHFGKVVAARANATLSTK